MLLPYLKGFDYIIVLSILVNGLVFLLRLRVHIMIYLQIYSGT
jgi:hypothetical protein